MKVVTFSGEGRKKHKEGVDLIANAVKVTLGPRGRNVVYGFHYGYPICTKDGVTVARQVEAVDKTAQIGLLLVRQVAQKTADDAGDGTTTAALLAQAIFTEGLRFSQSGANPILIKRGIDKAVKNVIEYIDSIKTKITDEDQIIKVASLSANNEKAIGELINEAIKTAGEDGVITLDDNYKDSKTVIEVMAGMQLMEGLVSRYFTNDALNQNAVIENPYLIIIDNDINHISQIKSICEEAIKTGRPVCLMANGFHASVLESLVNSRVKESLSLVVVKSPYFGEFRSEQLADIAALTGANVIGPVSGLRSEEAKLIDLGECGSIKANQFHTPIVEGRGREEEVKARVELIRNQIEEAESDYDKEKLRERLSKLTTGVAVIKVGAPTEVEQKEKKMRIEDALLAARAAIDGGVVPGGGVAYLRAADKVSLSFNSEEEKIGANIIKKSLTAPIKQIASNSGRDGADIIAGILWGSSEKEEKKAVDFGYDFLENRYGHLIEMGVIDPAKVVKTALINAASVAGMLLTTEVVCNEEEEDGETVERRGRLPGLRRRGDGLHDDDGFRRD